MNDTHSYYNGVKIVPAYLLEPQIVALDNVRDVYRNHSILENLVKQSP